MNTYIVQVPFACSLMYYVHNKQMFIVLCHVSPGLPPAIVLLCITVARVCVCLCVCVCVCVCVWVKECVSEHMIYCMAVWVHGVEVPIRIPTVQGNILWGVSLSLLAMCSLWTRLCRRTRKSWPLEYWTSMALRYSWYVNCCSVEEHKYLCDRPQNCVWFTT